MSTVVSGFQRALLADDPQVLGACRALRVHRSNLSRWRAGQQGISVANAQRVRAALAEAGRTVEIGWFFPEVPAPGAFSLAEGADHA